MNVSSQLELSKSSWWLLVCIMAYFVMNGAQLWETAIMIPAWTAAPPASLHFFNEPYGLDFKTFWIVMHSVHEVIFIIALVMNWRRPVRNPLLFMFAAHIAVRVWTITYFAPTIIWFQSLPVSSEVDVALLEKATLWKNLNYLRVGVFFAINICMVFLLRFTKPNRSYE